MRLLLCGLAAMLTLSYFANVSVRADDAPATSTISGILIDQACGAKMMTKDDPEAAAAEHTKDCATAEDCAKSGYAVISGKTMLKFDDNGDKLAKDFLAKTTMTKDIKVVVEGTVKGDTIAVTSLKEGM